MEFAGRKFPEMGGHLKYCHPTLRALRHDYGRRHRRFPPNRRTSCAAVDINRYCFGRDSYFRTATMRENGKVCHMSFSMTDLC